MKILWIDLNSSYAHSSLALPALHAQIADDTSIEWASVSSTINENIGTIVEEATGISPTFLPLRLALQPRTITAYHIKAKSLAP